MIHESVISINHVQKYTAFRYSLIKFHSLHVPTIMSNTLCPKQRFSYNSIMKGMITAPLVYLNLRAAHFKMCRQVYSIMQVTSYFLVLSCN